MERYEEFADRCRKRKQPAIGVGRGEATGAVAIVNSWPTVGATSVTPSLIIGEGSGIGTALAQRFLALSNTIIVAGRQRETLDTVVVDHAGMHALMLDNDVMSRASARRS